MDTNTLRDIALSLQTIADGVSELSGSLLAQVTMDEATVHDFDKILGIDEDDNEDECCSCCCGECNDGPFEELDPDDLDDEEDYEWDVEIVDDEEEEVEDDVDWSDEDEEEW